MKPRKFRSSQHQRRMERYARVPSKRGRGTRREAEFVWSPAQERANRGIFLFRKWVYDNSAITAYGINMRLWSRGMDKRTRKPKGEVK